jgi:hypothetical protein
MKEAKQYTFINKYLLIKITVIANSEQHARMILTSNVIEPLDYELL